MTHNWEAFRQLLNEAGREARPGLFIIDFEMRRPRWFPLSELDPAELLYNFQGVGNALADAPDEAPPVMLTERRPASAAHYRQAFAVVQRGLLRGDSFLANLTLPTPIALSGDLRALFFQSQARYRLWLRDGFACFSPETFIKIQDGRIFTYPMKGTRPARHPDDGRRLLDDPKEKAEHATIVDLLRNDLSRVARRVRVEQYRYLECIPTAKGGLWQTSSCIAGDLPPGYAARLGDLLHELLPAGSVSGAPKASTLRIIREAEGQDRGYYTGIAGYFDGANLDSCVLIRFIEQTDHGPRYWSGGGVTAQSQWPDEYQELLEKVYLSPQTAILSP
jgi:para-aminobenzoate synthetase component 1